MTVLFKSPVMRAFSPYVTISSKFCLLIKGNIIYFHNPLIDEFRENR